MATKMEVRNWFDFNELEQAAICLTAMVTRQGGKIIISSKEMSPDIGDAVLDIMRYDNGDVKIELLMPPKPQEGDLRYKRDPLPDPTPMED